MNILKDVPFVEIVENGDNNVENLVDGDSPTVVNKSSQKNTSRSSGVQGAANMSPKREKAPQGSRPGNTDGPDGSDTEPDRSRRQTSSELDDDPLREPDWFVPGMYIKMFAPNETGIHEKEFIILDSKNSAGKAVRVDQLSPRELKSWSPRNAVAIKPPRSDEETGGAFDSIRNSVASTKFTEISLEALGPDCEPPKNRYARLDHTYNIPFSGHNCKDLGIIEGASLRRLRLQYIKYLAASWEIEDDVGRAMGYGPSPKHSNRSTSPAESSRASVRTSGSSVGRKTGGNS